MVQNTQPYRQDNHIIPNVDLFASLNNRYTCYTNVNDKKTFECIDAIDSTDTPYFTVRYNELIKPNFFTTNYNKIENMCMFYKSGLPYLCLSVDTVGQVLCFNTLAEDINNNILQIWDNQ